MKKALATLVLWIVSIFAVPQALSQIPSAYQVVSQKYAVPSVVFYSMILQESGRSIKGIYHPWPWTLNVNHKAYRYDSKEEAALGLRQFLNGRNTIAVGLGQIYLPAHGHMFENPYLLLNPRVNLEYAALLLANEYINTRKKGQPSWWLAVGRYHAPSKEKYAKLYRQQVYEKCQRISDRCAAYGALHWPL